MEHLERIAAQVGRLACSPEHSPEALLESAGLVAELTTAFEALKQRELAPGDLPIADSAPPSADLTPPTPEEIERVVRDLLDAESA